jgi:hypothetical protein
VGLVILCYRLWNGVRTQICRVFVIVIVILEIIVGVWHESSEELLRRGTRKPCDLYQVLQCIPAKLQRRGCGPSESCFSADRTIACK